MPDEVETLQSLVSELHAFTDPTSPIPTLFIGDPSVYLSFSRGWMTAPAGSTPLLTEAQLSQLADILDPEPPAGAPDRDEVAQRLETATATNSLPDIIAGLSDLEQLSWPNVWYVLERLAARGPGLEGQTHLELLEGVARTLPNVAPRLVGAMIAELFNRGGRTLGASDVDAAVRLTNVLIDSDERSQLEIMDHLGLPPEAAEGTIAWLLEEAALPGLPLPPLLVEQLTKINLNDTSFLDWDMPEGQPGGVYLGNAAHTAIAAHYRTQHQLIAGHHVWTNCVPVRSIVRQLGSRFRFRPASLQVALALSRPDIFDFALVHGLPPGWVYEIKPARGTTLARAESRFYATALTLAGVPCIPGVPGAPGTSGVVPAPHGWFGFAAVEPGVIVYRWKRASKQRIEERQQVPADDALKRRIENALIGFGIGAAVAAAIAIFLAALAKLGWVVAFA